MGWMKKDSLAITSWFKGLPFSPLHTCCPLRNFSESVVCVPCIVSGICLLPLTSVLDPFVLYLTVE